MDRPTFIHRHRTARFSGIRGGTRSGLFTQYSPPVVLASPTSGQRWSETAHLAGQKATRWPAHTHYQFSHQKTLPGNVLAELCTHFWLPTKSIIVQMVRKKNVCVSCVCVGNNSRVVFAQRDMHTLILAGLDLL